MMPSVQERKKSEHSFMNAYPYICRLQNIVPNPNIKIDSSSKFLEFVCDRLKADDWKPVLQAISNDRSLHFISIRSRHSTSNILVHEPRCNVSTHSRTSSARSKSSPQVVQDDAENQVKQSNSPKPSQCLVNAKSAILVKMCEALSKCLSNSSTLTGLVLEKIPLDSDSLSYLTQGLECCQNLQQLSLPYSQIGDDGCATLCHVLRHRLNLIWLNLSGCGITQTGVGLLCNLLKFQKLNRYGESWKQSLRCRPVNPNIMPGLRRLTINQNSIGDGGVKVFVDTLVDDLWLKALDMQNCDITLVGGEALLSLVKENQFLSVVDIRGNIQVPNSTVAAIVQQLAENNSDPAAEFQWLKEDNPKKDPKSSISTSISKTTQRLGSKISLSSKIRSVLPNKTITLPHSPRTRSCSAKRVHTTSNTPRPPWNWNYSNTCLRRGNSDQLIDTTSKHKPDVLKELQSVKEQLLEVSRRLEEETERRIKIEKELEKYKELIEFSDGSMPLDKQNLQTFFQQFYNAYFNQESHEIQKRGKDITDQQHIQKHDSLESVIRTINENDSDLKTVMNKDKCLNTTCSLNGKTNPEDVRSRAQVLFETLLSS